MTTRDRTGSFFDIFFTYGAAGASETCTAPPPIKAPPQVQAHNFAIAIRTDIISSLFRCRLDKKADLAMPTARFVVSTCNRKTEEIVNHKYINPVSPCKTEKYVNNPYPSAVNVPNWNPLK